MAFVTTTFLKRAATASAAVLTLLIGASCTARRYDYSDCDYVDRRCRTICDYWCDGWGCYPVCYDDCWDDCRIDDRHERRPVSETADPPPATDAGATPATPPPAPAPAPGSSSGGTGGSGVLCTSCTSSADCESGALCIFRGGAGGADGGSSQSGFCGHACAASTDCPDGFLCSQIGSTRQCLPTTGTCR